MLLAWLKPLYLYLQQIQCIFIVVSGRREEKIKRGKELFPRLQKDRRGLHCMRHQLELLVQGWEITGNFEGGAWGEWVLGTERKGTQQRIMT